MGNNGQYPPDGDDLNEQFQQMGRAVRDGLNQAGERFRQAFDRLNQLWEDSAPYTPSRLTGSREEEYVRELARKWTQLDFLVTPDLADNMLIRSWDRVDLWEISIQTRWETRTFEITTEPFTGDKPTPTGRIMPIWDYQLAAVPDVRAQIIREHIPEGDELGLCLACNGTGRSSCTTCTGHGWVVCPDCKGRTKLRCPRCKGKAMIPDWGQKRQSRGFFQDQADKLTSSVADRASEVVDSVRQYIPFAGQNQPQPGAPLPPGMIPCPECINGEIDCTCGNGKRVCTVCKGTRNQTCPVCKGSGKVLRHREIVRRFDVRPYKQAFGESPVPQRVLNTALGEVITTVDRPEDLASPTPPEGVSDEVWRAAQEAAEANRKPINPDERSTLQVVEFLRIPVVRVAYLYGDEPFVFCAYDAEGHEKFYAESFPPRWKRVERFVRSVADQIMAPSSPPQGRVSDLESYRQAREGTGRQRIPLEMPQVVIKEEEPPASGPAPEQPKPAEGAPDTPPKDDNV